MGQEHTTMVLSFRIKLTSGCTKTLLCIYVELNKWQNQVATWHYEIPPNQKKKKKKKKKKKIH